jgi:hypothetical protein
MLTCTLAKIIHLLRASAMPIKKPPQKKFHRQKDYYPLIGRLRISQIVANARRNTVGNKGNGEFIRYLNTQMQNNPRFRDAYERLGPNLFNSTNVRKLLEAGEENENSFEIGLLQFIFPFTGEYTFGNLMDILANTGEYKMGEIASLMYIAITQNELSEEKIRKRLTKLKASDAGITNEVFSAFQTGILIPDQEQLALIKRALDPYEDCVNEGQWLEALLRDNGVAYHSHHQELIHAETTDLESPLY